MGKIGYGYGSEWHLLRYLGYHRELLKQAVLQETVGSEVKWLDFPFSPKNRALHQDQEYQGIEFIENTDVRKKWAEFWPQTGNPPNWDAVGILETAGGKEWLLVEAKANIEEIHSSCSATHPKSTGKISKAMAATQASFGSDKDVSQWFSPYYQLCNRLAILHFLTYECNPPIPARLIYIYFYGDQNPRSFCPPLDKDWHPFIEEMYGAIGVRKETSLFKRVHHLFLPVNPRLNP